MWINLQAYQLTKNLARLHLLVTKMEGFLKIVIPLRDEILLLVVDEQIVLEETQTVCKPYPNRVQFYVSYCIPSRAIDYLLYIFIYIFRSETSNQG